MAEDVRLASDNSVHPKSTPKSILIVGAGVFGLSTLVSLLANTLYDQTRIILLDTHLPLLTSYKPPKSHHGKTGENFDDVESEDDLPPQNPYAASIDSSRIVRPDYANPAYAKLALEAQGEWRRGYGTCAGYIGNGKRKSSSWQRCRIRGCSHSPVYRESGLALTAGQNESMYVKRSKQNAEALGMNVKDLSGREEITKLLDGDRGSYRLAKDSTSHIDNSQGRNGDGKVSHERAAQLGENGYVNWSSGWADNGRAMAHVMLDAIHASNKRNQDPSKGRVDFTRGRATSLLFSSSASTSSHSLHANGDSVSRQIPVTGVSVSPALLTSPSTTSSQPSTIHADLTILSAGAHTSSLLDLRSHAQATAQVLAYIPLTRDEASLLQSWPVLLNLSTGIFAIPPSYPNPSPAVGATNDKPYTLKIARHAYGYVNPTTISLNEPSKEPTTKTITTSVPSTFTSIPPADIPILLSFLHALFPPPPPPPPSSSASPKPSSTNPNPLSRLSPKRNSSEAQNLISSTRLCYYTDTPSGDFLITHHPEHPGLFLATGGSGHGFKFLPVLGRYIVNVIEGKEVDAGLGWGWKQGRGKGDGESDIGGKTSVARGGEQEDEGWVTEDGSRSGEKRVRLEDAFAGADAEARKDNGGQGPKLENGKEKRIERKSKL